MKKFTPIAFIKRLYSIVTDRGFVFLTLLGNTFIVIFSVLFYFLERDVNPHIEHVFDSIWWGYVTVTTVGYGEITPVTMIGKVSAIFLMIGGIGLFSTYTALFANTLMGREFHKIDKEVRKIKKNVRETQEEMVDFEFEERALLNTMERITRSIEKIDKRLQELEDHQKRADKS